MSKRLFKTLVAVLAIAAAATGPARAQSNSEELFYTLDGTVGGTNNAYNDNCDIVVNDITWNVTGNSQYTPWRIGGKTLNGVDRLIYSKGTVDQTIMKVTVEIGTIQNGITVNSCTMVVASDADFNNVIDTKSFSSSENSTVDITPSANASWTNAYYKFVFNVTVSGSSNKYFQLKSIKFYYDPNTSGGGSTPEPNQTTYNVTFSGFFNSNVNITHEDQTLPHQFTFGKADIASDISAIKRSEVTTSAGEDEIQLSNNDDNLFINVTAAFEGTATINVKYWDGEDNVRNINVTVSCMAAAPPQPHTVRMAAGTEEAANWSLSSGNASVQGTQVLENVMSGSQVTATYSGDRKVKSVKAVKYVLP